MHFDSANHFNLEVNQVHSNCHVSAMTVLLYELNVSSTFESISSNHFRGLPSLTFFKKCCKLVQLDELSDHNLAISYSFIYIVLRKGLLIEPCSVKTNYQTLGPQIERNVVF